MQRPHPRSAAAATAVPAIVLALSACGGAHSTSAEVTARLASARVPTSTQTRTTSEVLVPAVLAKPLNGKGVRGLVAVSCVPGRRGVRVLVPAVTVTRAGTPAQRRLKPGVARVVTVLTPAPVAPTTAAAVAPTTAAAVAPTTAAAVAPTTGVAPAPTPEPATVASTSPTSRPVPVRRIARPVAACGPLTTVLQPRPVAAKPKTATVTVTTPAQTVTVTKTVTTTAP